jgi:hypothetical protein
VCVRIAELNPRTVVEIDNVEGYEDDGEGGTVWAALGDNANLLPDECECFACGKGVGYVFTCREDSYGREVEGLEWREVWIDPELRLWCEECVYDVSERASATAERLAGA